VLHKLDLPAYVITMAWEHRERGGRYYYRSVREGQRVRKEYLGTGELAAILARGDELIRREREAEAAKWRTEVERMEALAAPVLELCEISDVLAQAHLVAGGYHLHKGEWRRERST
jgi:hypothetical protein